MRKRASGDMLPVPFSSLFNQSASPSRAVKISPPNIHCTYNLGISLSTTCNFFHLLLIDIFSS
jgi:hypothetical protein